MLLRISIFIKYHIGDNQMKQINQKILHRRWIITGIVGLIIITLLHLWIFIGLGIFLIACYIVTVIFINWITGADLNDLTDHSENNNISNDEKILWDYLIWSELFKNK